MSETELLISGDSAAAWTLILAHGAGQGMHASFLTTLAEGLGEMGETIGGIRTLRFEFPYMAARSRDGRRRPPDRQPKLLACYRDVIAAVVAAGAPPERLAIGGKSMGGRMASLLADEQAPAALVCLGYPFHPPGRPERLRTEHLKTLSVPTLICQGERDTFGGRAEVADFDLSKAIQFCWLPDGDHSFKPRNKSGHSLDGNLNRAMEAILAFLGGLNGAPT